MTETSNEQHNHQKILDSLMQRILQHCKASGDSSSPLIGAAWWSVMLGEALVIEDDYHASPFATGSGYPFDGYRVLGEVTKAVKALIEAECYLTAAKRLALVNGRLPEPAASFLLESQTPAE